MTHGANGFNLNKFTAELISKTKGNNELQAKQQESATVSKLTTEFGDSARLRTISTSQTMRTHDSRLTNQKQSPTKQPRQMPAR